MIYAYELILLNGLKAFWKDLVSKIGTPDDVIPDVFPYLPAEGDFGANQKAIGELCQRLTTGTKTEDLTFILEFPVRTNIPCVFIETGEEQEEEVIGGDVDEYHNPDTDEWEMQTGGVFHKRFRIGVYSFNADTTLYLYSIIKYGLLLLRSKLGDAANFGIQSEKMQQDYQRFHPDIVYVRYFNLAVEGVLDTVVERAGTYKAVTVTVTNEE